MIIRIQRGEYLKWVGNMSAAEKEEYLGRVGEWLEKQAPLLVQECGEDAARFQNAVQRSAAWNDAEHAAWTEGVRLMTAMIGKADTWLPDDLYSVSARRAVKRIVSVLKECRRESARRAEGPAVPSAGRKDESVVRHAAAAGGQGVAEKETAETLGTVQNIAAVPARPKHIDQYVHLLPVETQKRAATVQGLLRDLDVARGNMRLLMDEPSSNGDSRAQWAKTATALDSKIKVIYKELDAEWEKLVRQGRVVVDGLGMARVVKEESSLQDGGTEETPAGENGKEDSQRKPGRPPMTEEEEAKAKEAREAARAEKKAAEDARRREYLKKWLRDARTAASDERRRLWEKNCMELLSLGGELTNSIRKAGEHYGVDIASLEAKD